jgi:Dolichyl-phosphate-mannose-protein mannosyltransferase
MLAVLALAGVGCLLGAFDQPGPAVATLHNEVLDLARVLCTTAIALSLLLGPGILVRLYGPRIGLAYVPLPGLALLIATALLAWVASGASPRAVCFAVFVPVLALIAFALISSAPEDIFDREEQRVLGFCGLALGVAIGRTIWSLDPAGGLYAGTISRTFYAEPRPDSRIPFLISEMIAHHQGPYSPASAALFSPYNFSSRGPLGGLAAAPVVFMGGGRPPIENPEMPWAPFDEQGFMAFRLAMMTYSVTVLLSLWELVKRVAGSGAARFAVILGAATPFLMDELIFTWPKLLAASFVLLGALAIIERRAFLSGIFVGIGYLMHPSALLALAAIGLLALWPLRGANWKRPDIKAAVLLGVGVAISLIVWRVVNGSHYDQNGFLEYFREAGSEAHPSAGAWLNYRLGSLGNTTVPLMLPLFYATNHSINQFGGQSPWITHFMFQYWAGVPFGLAIIFFPMLLYSLYKAAVRWPWPFFAVVVAPLVLFTAYWGSSVTGMLREGMQSWVFALLAVVAVQQAAANFSYLRGKLTRAILSLRALEALFAVVGMTLDTDHQVMISHNLTLNDLAAWALMLACSLGMAWAIWRSRAPDPDET